MTLTETLEPYTTTTAPTRHHPWCETHAEDGTGPNCWSECIDTGFALVYLDAPWDAAPRVHVDLSEHPECGRPGVTFTPAEALELVAAIAQTARGAM